MREASPDDTVWIRVNQKLTGIELSDEDFATLIAKTFGQYQEIMVIEDRNKRFGAEFGPVGVVAAIVRGQNYEPHVEWFEWATPQNKLRGAVAFLQKCLSIVTGKP